jgi:hypothetical protein
MTIECLDLTGRRFGRWIVLGKHSKKSQWLWLCRCECGTEKPVFGCALRTGDSLSCGCLAKELLVKRTATHRMTKTPIYRVWRTMLARCYRPEARGYERYGGRGIAVCDRWQHSFEAFYADMGDRPGPRYQLDRRDNDGNYARGTCRWATAVEQGRNKSTNKRFAWRGERLTVGEIAERVGMREGLLRQRVSRGASIDRAIAMPDPRR